MEWDRRTFLQTLLTWGVSQGNLGWLNQPNKLEKYYQTLAEPTHRKLALLIGINDYAERFDLKGCLTDVERQRELLIYRFGFNPQDILTLTEKQATREGIETAFMEHLVAQAKAGDVVLFHFSGYGNQVNITPEDAPTVTNGQVRGFIPSDGILLNKGTPTTNNILEETLILLGQSLATEKLTMVLDTSHYCLGKTIQGNLRVRSFPHTSKKTNPEELAFQAQLKSQVNKSNHQGQSSAIPGIILSAAGHQQVATEIKGNGFSAGLFTYALTQYLWSATPASRVTITLNKTTEQVVPIMGKGQQPQTCNDVKQPLFTYYLLPTIPQGAEAVIHQVEDASNATIKFTGIPNTILQNYGLDSCFRLISSPQTSPVLWQLRSREGLKGKVRQLNSSSESTTPPLTEGQFLQESVRCLPRNVGLIVALDQELQRIERVDATSAFSSITMVSSVITAGEQAADCVLGLKSSPPTVTDETTGETEEENGKYGLFLPGGVLLSNTLGKEGEAIKSAVERLRPTLEKLLAAKLWGLTLNEGSSQLPWRVTLEGLDPEPHQVEQRQTTRTAQLKSITNAQEETATNAFLSAPSNVHGGLPQVSRGSRLQYRLENQAKQTLYYMMVGIDSGGRAIAYVPPKAGNEQEIKTIASLEPGAATLVPTSETGLIWTTAGTQGWEQVLVIASIAPFEKTLKTLKNSSGFKANKGQILILENPLEIARSLLQDLNEASFVQEEVLETTSDSYALDVKAWSTLSFVYQVV
ncbi:MAG: caspase family protein [Cyanobacteria bacterium P01_G01_bin.49]